MTTSLAIQYGVIALAALLSAWVVLKKQFPQAARRACVAMATPLLREGRPAWLRALAGRIAPPTKSATGSCGGCDSCGPSAKS